MGPEGYMVATRTFTPSSKYLILSLGQSFKDDLRPLQHNVTMIREIPAHSRELLLPDPQKCINGAFANLKGRKMGEEIIADEEYEEDPVINSLFEVEREVSLGHIELDFEIFTEDGDIEENKWFFRVGFLFYFYDVGSSTLCCIVTFLPAFAARGRVSIGKDILTKNPKIWFMCRYPEHNKISILKGLISV
jgi:hypothetical protein